VGDCTQTAKANPSPTGWAPTKAMKAIAHGVGSHNKTIRPQGGLPQRQQNQSPTGVGSHKGNKAIAHGVGSHKGNKAIAHGVDAYFVP
jgi:hypothetical protein